jgi:hypothetical protein
MGFFDTLRRVLSGVDGRSQSDPHADLDEPSKGLADAPAAGVEIEIDSEATTPGPDIYDRLQWHKKLKRILGNLPAAQADWPDLIAEARALGFDPEWVERCQAEEFKMLVRRAVSDRHLTEDEHRALDLARDLIGLTEDRAEAILHAIVAEAEAFFGKPVEDS